MSKKSLLITFIRNPGLGKVKTRIADEVGEKKALEIYITLLTHTRAIVSEVEGVDHALYYSETTDNNDLWPSDLFQKFIQKGKDVGERMKNAFEESFNKGYEKVVLTGCDIYDLSPDIIHEAFLQLNQSELVIGPAFDGGYYLIGMKKPEPELFKEIAWSTSVVLDQTIKKIKESEKSYKLLNTLADIDRLSDIYNNEELSRIIFNQEEQFISK